jgi:hypothetical protein
MIVNMFPLKVAQMCLLAVLCVCVYVHKHIHSNCQICKFTQNLAMGWMVWVLNPSSGKRFFCSLECPGWLWGPPSLLFSGYRVSFLGVEQLGCGIDRSPPPSAEFKYKWWCIPLYAFMAWTVITLPLYLPGRRFQSLGSFIFLSSKGTGSRPSFFL